MKDFAKSIFISVVVGLVTMMTVTIIGLAQMHAVANSVSRSEFLGMLGYSGYAGFTSAMFTVFAFFQKIVKRQRVTMKEKSG